MTEDRLREIARSLRPAARRRRLRRALRRGVLALVPGLALSLVFTALGRAMGSNALLAAGALVPIMSFAAGALGSLSFHGKKGRDELALAAFELDERLGLEALLATGLDVARGAAAGRLGCVTLRRAAAAARSSPPSAVEVSPQPWARYLAFPAAVAVGLLLMPRLGAEGRSRPRPAIEEAPAGTGVGEGAAVRKSREARAGKIGRGRLPGDTERIRPAEKATAAPRKERLYVLDKAALRSLRKPGARSGAPGAGRKGTRGAGRTRAEGGLLVSSEKKTSPRARGRPQGRGAYDKEAAILQERFPEYEGVIRRYFMGERAEERG